MSEYLQPDINQNVQSGFSNKAVKSAIKMIGLNQDIKVIRDSKNILIQQLFDEGFEVTNVTGTRKISSKMMQQAIWRTANRMKPLDFGIHGTGRPASNELIVTEGVGTVMQRGGYVRALRDKGGAFYNLLMYGDAMVQVGSDPDNNRSPIVFNPISNSNIYVDSYATGVRSGGLGRAAQQMCVIFSMSWGTFLEEYPEAGKTAGIGQIPRDTGLFKELERDYIQTYKLDDLIEVAHYYDIKSKNYTCFAGSQCTVLDEYSGDDYPFEMDGEAYIPVLQFICMPSSAGFWNNGLGNMLYDLAYVSKQMLNMGVGHAEDNTYPYTLINVPAG